MESKRWTFPSSVIASAAKRGSWMAITQWSQTSSPTTTGTGPGGPHAADGRATSAASPAARTAPRELRPRVRRRRASPGPRQAAAAARPAASAIQPPDAGHECALKFRSCFDPTSGGWYVIPGTSMIAVSASRSWP